MTDAEHKMIAELVSRVAKLERAVLVLCAKAIEADDIEYPDEDLRVIRRALEAI